MNPKELVLDDGSDLRETKIRESAATERARIEATETTKRALVKEREETRRAMVTAHGDGWWLPKLIVSVAVVVLALIAYFAYKVKLEAGAAHPASGCKDEIFMTPNHDTCTPGAMGHIVETKAGNHFECTCINPLVVEAPPAPPGDHN